MDGISYPAIGGGLLLEPGVDNHLSVPTDGSSTLKFFGVRAPGEASDFLAGSSEAYRWVSANEISISRRDSELGAQFSGVVDAQALTLRATNKTRFLPVDTHLRFLAAPDEPISDAWRATFDSGGPTIRPSDSWYADVPLVLAAIRKFILAGEPERQRASRARLEYAWRAPA